MAKGSVRKKGKKWYYRYYVEDASGNLVQKECVGALCSRSGKTGQDHDPSDRGGSKPVR